MYTIDGRVRYSELNEQGNLSVTGILNYFQDCSTFQSEDIGLGIAYLQEKQRAWWLSSWQVVIDRYPKLGEKIKISTWPYDFKGMYGYRNFLMQDEAGNNLVRANSVWFFYDLEAGRPVRIQAEDIRGYGNGEEEKLDMEYAPKKITVPEDAAEGEAIVISNHHIDTNHHVNNAKYIEIAREVLPDTLTVKELRAEYKKAAVYGDIMIPHISRTEEGYVVSLCDPEKKPYAVVWLEADPVKR